MSVKRQLIHKALFSCTNIELPKAVKRKSSTDKNNSGITINIFNVAENSILGTLYIGQGGFAWRPKNCTKSKSLNWSDVATMLNNRLANKQGV
jgi:hypothetical protein